MLCVIYDAPLPEFYQRHSTSPDNPFPYAIAMILGNVEGVSYRLELAEQTMQSNVQSSSPFDIEPLKLLELLTGISDEIELTQNGMKWCIAKVES